MRYHLPLLLAVVLAVSVTGPAVVAGAGPAQSASASTQPAADCTYPMEVTDATGESMTIDSPDSIVALQPSDAQTVFEIGAEDRLVGMPDNPATSDLEMGDRESISDGYDVVDEQVVALDPDIVLAANVTDGEDVDQLRDAGLDVYVFAEAGSIDDVRENVVQTGELVDECDGAERTVEWMDDRIDLLQTPVEDTDRPLAYYEMGEGATAGAGSFQHEILAAAGLDNLAADVGIGAWGTISSETIVENDPDWIIHPDYETIEFDDAVETTTGYQDGNVFAVDENWMSQPAPHVVFALESIVEEVYPETYAEIESDIDELDAAYETAVTDTDEEPEDEATDSIAGFGAIAAAGGLLLALAIGSRRR